MTRPLHDLKRSHRDAVIRWVIPALLAMSTACAQGDTPNYTPKNNNDTEDLGARDLGQSDDLGQREDQAPDMRDVPDQGEDQGKDLGPLVGEFKLCVLQDRDPWSATCDEEPTLDFGAIYSGQLQTRRVRIDNVGGTKVILERATLEDPELEVSVLSYDRAEPPNGTLQNLPLEILAGESATIEVSWLPGLNMRTLDGLNLELSARPQDEATSTTSQIAIKGSLAGCPPLSASCDEEVNNGCETPINTLTNCGGCGTTCALNFATESCAQGQCVIDTCDANYRSCDGQDSTGCETNILNSLDHCGDCQKPCDYPNATESCIQGQCTFGECQPGFASCDMNQDNGCETNTSNDVQHCGACFNSCARPGATVTCQSSACQFTGCQAGFYDLDNNPANGCEYACNFQSATDDPDPMGIDANCDGIDGEISRGIFVAIDGDDANPGSPAAPVRTIAKALTMAKNISGLDQIYISAGRYREQLYLDAGVSLYGGYQRAQGWAKDPNFKSEIYWDVPTDNRIVALRAINIQTPTTIDQLYITTADALNNGISTYAVHCQSCNRLTISNSVLQAGRGGPGVHGNAGVAALTLYGTSGNGGNGTQGSDNGSTRGQGGAGGSSPCGRPGGKGGQGGAEGKNRGEDGRPGTVNVSGGAGGAGGDPGKDGGDGTTGPAGSNGSHGNGGGIGVLTAGFYIGQDGTSGSDGTHGNGGGGGGGGGGQGCTFCNDGTGNGGGGGGGGGCAGSAGTGGKSGGSSFGLFLYQSTGIALNDNLIISADGGNGGNGGTGGAGTPGGNKGLGNTHASSDIGEGGDGGTGGRGGNGGDGGGGAGGLSYAIYRSSTTIGLPGTNILSYGTPGQGGGPASRAGTNGQGGQHN